ncbi:MAG: PQQ-binding-like beta-propeller repeat protein, partial [Bacteroidota bacterium]
AKGPAYNSDMDKTESKDTAWPAYRHDAARSGYIAASVPTDLKRSWEAELPASPSSPTVAEGKMFVASTNSHTVYALDANTGKKLWNHTTGGRVDTPPTYYKGRVLFGSRDGWVYCLDAADGTLAWRFRAAPMSRLILDHGRLASAWGLHGSVLIHEGKAYVSAGRSSFLDGGIYVYVLDPRTGEILQKEQVYSYHMQQDMEDRTGLELPYDMPPEHPGALSDILLTNGDHVYMRHLQFNAGDISKHQLAGDRATLDEVLNSIENREDAHDFKYTGQHPGSGKQLLSNSGLLDDTWFNQSYWSVNGIAHSRMLCFNDEQIFGLKAFEGSGRHDRSTFAPRKEDYTLFSVKSKSGKNQWSTKIPLRVRAMVLAGDKLFVAGPPNEVPEEDPWAAFEGKKGSELWVYSASDGKKLARYKLGAKPVYDGMMATQGRLYISLQDGRVLCLEGK